MARRAMTSRRKTRNPAPTAESEAQQPAATAESEVQGAGVAVEPQAGATTEPQAAATMETEDGPAAGPEEGAPDAPTIPDVLPVLPLRGGTVVFPLAVIPLLVGQERSVRLVDDVMRKDRMVALVAQRPEAPDQP